MESIGKINQLHLSDYEHCGVKDYLNFFCSNCKRNLCKDHYHNDVSCPFQNTIPSNQGIVKQEGELFNKSNDICSFCSCSIVNSAGFLCKMCNLIFCVHHKVESYHNCKNGKKSMRTKYQEGKELFKKKLQEMKRK